MAELVEALQHLGFSAKGVKLEPSSIERLSSSPVILHVDGSHFLVSLPVGDGTLVVVDPPHRVQAESVSAITSRWTGDAIVVQNTPDELRKRLASIGIRETANPRPN
jgi:ABC-type bacteriocin/lantibiotic exporter with double-glycine peptidase domain